MSRPISVEQFVKDTATHKMKVLRDDGLYRHIRFASEDNPWNLWFELVTWPNALIIRGDMGSWSFSRLEDMFEFFRCDGLRINPSYWGEKIQSESRFGGPHRKFHADTFQANVLESLDDYDLEEPRKAKIIEELESEVFGEEDEGCARRALSEFEYRDEDGKFEFSDSWEIDGEDYTYQYLWCCYAIQWGIAQYDVLRASTEAE